ITRSGCVSTTFWDTDQPTRESACALRRIVAPAMEWLTLQNPPHAPQASRNDSIFLDGQNEILAARGVKATLPAKNGAEKRLVSADQTDHAAGRKALQPARQRVCSVGRCSVGLWHQPLSDELSLRASCSTD